MRFAQPVRRNHRAGISLIEVAIVMGIIGILTAIAIPSIQEMLERRRLQGFARDLGNMFQIARSQAIRTGNYQIVFFGPLGTTDGPAGTVLVDSDGATVPMLILDDGPPATANCHIDGGEDQETIPLPNQIAFGVSEATFMVPTDTGTAGFTPPQTSGTTASDASNNATNWALFRPDGIPVGFEPTATTCGTIGDTGTGGLGLYVNSGGRDYAVTLAPLGGVRVHAWNGGAWTE
ncbi:MAG: prepilin-type N-terminal cleavage/methylation domain-containing protein [Myxococcales bacterium]|nr:prepilin-type N-terminal cleavage/methylation domain-containing protein [Myxococcales bacterium]